MIKDISVFIKTIGFYLVFMAFVSMVMPAGAYKKYVNLILGLVLLILLLSPLSNLLGKSSEQLSGQVAEIFATPKEENPDNYLTVQNEAIAKDLEERLKDGVGELLKDTGYKVVDIWAEADMETFTLKSITLTLTKGEPPSSKFLVEPVTIGNGKEDSSESGGATKDIIKTISDFYKVTPDNIHVKIQR